MGNAVDYATVTVSLNAASPQVPIKFTLRPSSPGQTYMVYMSNCAVIHDDGVDRKLTSLNFDRLTLSWKFKGGNLGRTLAPLVAFYAAAFCFYALLSALWLQRSWKFKGSLLGLQKAVAGLVYCETAFSLVALTYYVHLNKTDVDLNVLYSGTFAALEKWDLWSFVVTAAHFSTIFACQAVVTLVADGKWLIQHSMRRSTKAALVVLAGLWTVLILFYGAMDAHTRRGWCLFSGLVWLLWLLVSVRSSLKHIRSLTVGASDDNVSVAHPGSLKAGDMLTAKRSLFRKMCCLIGSYVAVFAVTLIMDSRANKAAESSVPWLGFVLSDIYIWLILGHTTWMWIPTPKAKEDAMRYAPVRGEDGEAGVGEGEEGEGGGEFDGDFEMT